MHMWFNKKEKKGWWLLMIIWDGWLMLVGEGQGSQKNLEMPLTVYINHRPQPQCVRFKSVVVGGKKKKK